MRGRRLRCRRVISAKSFQRSQWIAQCVVLAAGDQHIHLAAFVAREFVDRLLLIVDVFNGHGCRAEIEMAEAVRVA